MRFSIFNLRAMGGEKLRREWIGRFGGKEIGMGFYNMMIDMIHLSYWHRQIEASGIISKEV
jgi:hypothetical protein